MNKKKLIRSFLLKALIAFLIWEVVYLAFIQPDGTVDKWLTEVVVDSSVSGLNLIGFDSYSKENIIYINGKQSVLVANPCNGLELFALYVGFLICFPGGWKSKLVYSTVGCVLIATINVIREIALALNYNYFRATFDLNHKYTYTLIVYVFIFLLWKHWLSRYSVLGTKSTSFDE